MQQPRKNKREGFDFRERMIQLECIRKHWRRLFQLQVPFGFSGRELLQTQTRLAQTFGNTGDRQRRELGKRAHAPEPQRFKNLRRRFLFDLDQLVSKLVNRKLAEARQLFARRNKRDSAEMRDRKSK